MLGVAAMIAFEHVAAQLRGTAKSNRLEHEQMQGRQHPAILLLESGAVEAENISNFQGRSWHDLPAIGRLHVFGQKIWKGVTGTCCTVGNVHIDGGGLQAGVPQNLLDGPQIHTRLQAMGSVGMSQNVG